MWRQRFLELWQSASMMNLGGLPDPLTELIGREAELAAVVRFLAPGGGGDGSDARRTRLLTLVGAGGVGKTRLAIEAAHRLGLRFSDGARFVPLASVAEPDRVPLAIAQALGLSDAANRPVEEQLRDYLSGCEMLLVLDNFEHVLNAASVVGRLLAAAPRLSVLITSREGLRVSGEQQYPVPPLEVPCREPLPPVDVLAQAPSVALFVERARAVAPDFALTPGAAPAVAEVVCRLDGLPLAIELAAARANVLPMPEIARRLDDSLRLLTTGARDSDPRHESMRATLDWSYALLSEPERAILARLAVFRGSFPLAAAEAVGEDIGIGPKEILDLLSRLVDHSLVVAVPTVDGEARYLLHEVIRQYALQRLAASGAEAQARDRHLDFYLTLAESADPLLRGEYQVEWLDRLEREYDNLRVARDWAGGAPERAEGGLRLVRALWSYWRLRGLANEARRWTEEALATADLTPAGSVVSPRARAGGLQVLALAMWWQGQDDTAYHLASQSRALYCTLGEAYRWDQAALLFVMAQINAQRYEPFDPSLRLPQVLEAWRAVGDPWGEAITLLGVAEASAATGDVKEARRLLEEAWEKGVSVGDRQNLGNILSARAAVEAEQGETVEAVRLCGESLRCYAELGNKGKVGGMLHALADLLTDTDGIPRSGGPAEAQRLRHATALFGASDTLLRLSGFDLPWPRPQPARPLSVTEVRERLGADAYTAAFAQGQAMTLETAVAHAESVVQAITAGASARKGTASPLTPRQAARERYGGVTAREREVAAFVARGRSNSEIAAALVLSERTVETHVTNILNKLGYDSRTQIAAWAVRVGLNS